MFEAVPHELIERPQWVLWRRQTRGGKETKVPYQTSGALAAVDKPDTWASFEAVVSVLGNGGGFDGIGFVITKDDPYVGVDLDGNPLETVECLQTVFRLRSYTERSPSGKGVHIWIRAKLPPDENPRRRKGKIEVYESGRYLTVTGNKVGSYDAIEERTAELASVYDDFLRTHPRAVSTDSTEAEERADLRESAVTRERADGGESAATSERAENRESAGFTERAVSPDSTGTSERAGEGLSDGDLLRRIFAAQNGPAVEALWQGQWSPKYPSQSEGDLALASHLVWWSDGDLERADRLFRASGLMRSKWDEKHGSDTYGNLTLARVAERLAHRGFVPRQRAVAPAEAPSPASAAIEPRRIDIDGGEALMSRSYPELVWRVHELLPEEGLCLLVGRPKIGKSWLALQLALAVANGETFLERATTRTDVLALALEDSPRRLQRRLFHLTVTPESARGLSYAVDWLPLSGGGVELLDTFLTENPGTGMVIIDTFAAISGPAPKNVNAYEYDYSRARALAQLSIKHRCLVVVLHHDRKADSEDWLLTVSGTQGLTGGADAVLMLRRSRGAANGFLHVTGRDLIEQKLAVGFNDASWTLLAGDADEYELNSKRKAVLAFMAEIGKPMTAAKIAEGIEGNRESAKKLLRRMAKDGLVRLDDKGWSLPEWGHEGGHFGEGGDIPGGDIGGGVGKSSPPTSPPVSPPEQDQNQGSLSLDGDMGTPGNTPPERASETAIPAWIRDVVAPGLRGTSPPVPTSPPCPGCGLAGGHAELAETHAGSGRLAWHCPRCGHRWVAEAEEGAVHVERADPPEGAVQRERAEDRDSTDGHERAIADEGAGTSERAEISEGAEEPERAGNGEGTEHSERAEIKEGAGPEERAQAERAKSAEVRERAVANESAGDGERAVRAESAETDERAASTDSTGIPERAARAESAAHEERAASCESTGTDERATPIESAASEERAVEPESTDARERGQAASHEGTESLERPPPPSIGEFNQMTQGELLRCPACEWSTSMDHPQHPGWRWCFRCHQWFAKSDGKPPPHANPPKRGRRS